MAYTIVKTDGTILTTIEDGTINTTSTPQGLPGRNFAGYGATLDTNFVHQLENFAASSVPAHALRGQLWYNTNNNTLNVCPADGTTSASSWLTLAQAGSSGTTTFGNVTVIGDVLSNNITAGNAIIGDTINVRLATVTGTATIATAGITTGAISSLTTAVITTGGSTTPGTLTGNWTLSGNVAGGNSKPTSVLTNNYLWANGSPVSFAGTYGNANVATYLPTFEGSVGNVNSNVTFRGNVLTTGSSATAGVITGNWTLSSGSHLNATYADLAERFAADAEYAPGTVVEIGGTAEITAVKTELSENVLGVISFDAAYLMNSGAGDNKTHPPVAIGGRVPVKVTGQVKKGDRLVSAGNGTARSAANGEATAFNTIGRSLADSSSSQGIVEAIVVIKG